MLIRLCSKCHSCVSGNTKFSRISIVLSMLAGKMHFDVSLVFILGHGENESFDYEKLLYII